MHENPKQRTELAPKKEVRKQPSWMNKRLAAVAILLAEAASLYHPHKAQALDTVPIASERVPMSEAEVDRMVDVLHHAERLLECRPGHVEIAQFSFGLDERDGRSSNVQSSVHMEREGERLADVIDHLSGDPRTTSDDQELYVTAVLANYHGKKTDDRTDRVEVHTESTIQLRNVIARAPEDLSRRLEARGQVYENTGVGTTVDGAISAALTMISLEMTGGRTDHVEGREGYTEEDLAATGRASLHRRVDYDYVLNSSHHYLSNISFEIVSSPDPDTHTGTYQVRVRAQEAVVSGGGTH